MTVIGALDRSHRAALERLLGATRAFRPDEIAVALELFDETFGSSAGSRGLPDYEFVAAFNDAGSLTGYCCYGATPGTHGTYDLYWIAVDPVCQGAGVGSALLAEVERRLQERTARLLVVETSGRDAYDATRRFYGARGYRVAAQLRDFYAPADDRLVYTRDLSSSLQPASRGA
ncbi:MAG TPA: GNAT family N-acetyltransferase [Gemmatimonadaceae bacterium]|nr:GNAT family N-acetyltransferase [Gemmatimonadaceae bacterium]